MQGYGLPENTEKWMSHALELAKKALKLGEVPVGCVFLHDGEIIAEGHNSVNETRNATRHAEMNCVDQVVKWCLDSKRDSKEIFTSIEVIVTVEPCIMCALALFELGVKSVTFGCCNDRFGGCGSVFNVSSLCTKPCPFVGGVCASEAMQLLKEFYKGTNPNAPVPKVRKKQDGTKNKQNDSDDHADSLTKVE